MTYLLNLITYDGKHYHETIDKSAQEAILDFASRLLPIEPEIMKHQDGVIDIRSTGIVFTTFFPPEIGQQIRDLLSS